jgi:hypothetical protein
MSIRLEKPTSAEQYDAWVRIMSRVSGQEFEAEELIHAIETDVKSAWILAYLDDEPVGTGVGGPPPIAGKEF